MGLEIGIGWLTILLFGSLALLLMLGLPMAFCTGSLAVIFLFVFGNGAILNMLPSRIFPFMTDYQLSAVPLFIFMAAVLEKAGIIEELFDVIYKWLGALKGGLASATVLACTVLAAMVGVVGATEVTMGMIALPAMLKRGYEPKLACGSLLAGGTLGILIPPSVMAIVYAVVAQQSLGELLIGSVFPGLLLSGIYIGYVTLRCYINPSLGPALPVNERVSFREKLRLLRNTITPILVFVLGMFLDWVGILLLTVPIFLPIMKSLPFAGAFGLPGVAPEQVPLWYGVIFMVNMQMAFLSPPFGYSLFYLKSVAPPQISMAMIFQSAIPFIGLQILGLALCIIFPAIILWLPHLLYAAHG